MEASKLFDEGKLDEALQRAKEVAASGSSDAKEEAMKLQMSIYLARGEADEALQVADQLIGSLGDKAKKAAVMTEMASIHLSREGGYSEAVSALKKAQALYKEAKDKVGEVETLATIVDMSLGNDEVSEALKVAQEAVSAASGDKKAEGAALRALSSVHLAKGSDADAMKAAKEAADSSKDAGDSVGQAAAMNSLAQMYLSKDNPTAALETAAEALRLCRGMGNMGVEASAQFMCGNAHLMMDGSSQEGVGSLKEAAALFSKVGDVSGCSTTLHTLANAHFENFDLEEGLNCAREALACYRRLGDAANADVLKQTIEQARAATAEVRKTTPKRPVTLAGGGGAAPSSGPEKSTVTESTVPGEVLDVAAAGRKYWGVPKMVGPDPTVGAAERAPSHIIVWGHCLSDNVPTQNCIEFGDLVGCMAKGDVAKTPIVIQTCGVNSRMTGQHIPSSFTNVAAVTIWGMARTVRQEIPQVQVALLDFSEELTAAQIPRQLRPAIPFVMESAYYHHARYEPQLAQVPSLFRRELKRDNLTGGGGGSAMGDPKKTAKFMRRSFNWTGPTHKLDYCWYRQEWRACGPAEGDIGPMPPPPPCRALRSI